MADDENKPPVSIKSSFSGKTYAYADIKSHQLVWIAKTQTLEARITFSNQLLNPSQAEEDDLDFPFPGISYDQPSGNFCAITTTGEPIPVARFKKVLFAKAVELLPNAAVRLVHNSDGTISAIMEAIRPADIAKYKALPVVHDCNFSLGSLFHQISGSIGK